MSESRGELDLGLVVAMVTVSAPQISMGGCCYCVCVEWNLGCERSFLSIYSLPSAFSCLCTPAHRVDLWKIPWTEEPGRLQSIGSQRVKHS